MSAAEWKKLEDEGMQSFNSIARELGITEQAVASTYKRAIRKLRQNPEIQRMMRELCE